MHTVKRKAADAAALATEYAQMAKSIKPKPRRRQRKLQRRAGKGEIAHERRKVKEAEAKMMMHEAKAEHAANKLQAGHHSLPVHHQGPVRSAVPPTSVAAPAYPPGGYPPGWTAPR